MEGKKYIFLLIVVWLPIAVISQNNPSIYKAYIGGDMKRWKVVMDSIEKRQIATEESALEQLNYQYGYIAWCISNNHKTVAADYVKKSELLIERLEKKRYQLSMVSAYKAAIIGFKIGISPMKAPFLGSESLQCAERSVKLDSKNAFGYMQLGNIAYYTPKILGGSNEEAIRYYLNALKLMEGGGQIGKRDWNYLNLLATIIHYYKKEKQYEEARYYCKKALEVEPNFEWVKKQLYPQLINL